MLFSDSAGIQTLDLQNRNLTLYSAKLRNQFECKITKKRANYQIYLLVFTSAYPFDYGVLCLSVGNGKDKACPRSVLPVNINAASHFLCNGTTDIENESRTLLESIKFFETLKDLFLLSAT